MTKGRRAESHRVARPFGVGKISASRNPPGLFGQESQTPTRDELPRAKRPPTDSRAESQAPTYDRNPRRALSSGSPGLKRDFGTPTNRSPSATNRSRSDQRVELVPHECDVTLVVLLSRSEYHFDANLMLTLAEWSVTTHVKLLPFFWITTAGQRTLE